MYIIFYSILIVHFFYNVIYVRMPVALFYYYYFFLYTYYIYFLIKLIEKLFVMIEQVNGSWKIRVIWKAKNESKISSK